MFGVSVNELKMIKMLSILHSRVFLRMVVLKYIYISYNYILFLSYSDTYDRYE